MMCQLNETTKGRFDPWFIFKDDLATAGIESLSMGIKEMQQYTLKTVKLTKQKYCSWLEHEVR